MNIGLVTTWFERGAAYVSRQYRDELKNGHQVFIYARGGESCGTGDSNWDVDNVTWGRQTLNPIPTAIDLPDFRKWLRRNEIALVFFNEQHWWDAVLECRAAGITVGSYIDYYTEQTVPFFNSYDFLVCNTKRHHSVFSWHPQCHYVPWGTDIDVFKPSTLALVKPGVVTFFHSGGVSPLRKGCDLVLQAFARLEGAAELVLHVQQPLRETMPELAPLINQLEAQGKLTVIERSVHAPGLFHLGDVYVYPTRLEGIGLTVMEATACGLPVIVTDTGPMTEFVEQGVNGAHVQVEKFVARSDGYYWPQAFVNVVDLAAKMQRFVDAPQSIPPMKSAARNFALSQLDWRANARILPVLFEQAVRRDDPSIAQTIDRIKLFECRRHELHRLRGYQRLRSTIELRHPRLFSVASASWGRVRSAARLILRRDT